MINSELFPLIVWGIIAFIWFIPLLIIMSSSKTSGSEKLGWIMAMIFISWFAWIIYLLLAPIKNK